MQAENAKRKQENGSEGEEESTNDDAGDLQNQDSQEQDTEPVQVTNWFENVKKGPVLLRVCATNKDRKKVDVNVSFKSESNNIIVPSSFFKEQFLDADTKCMGHLIKVDPTKEWGSLKVTVESKLKNPSLNSPIITTSKFALELFARHQSHLPNWGKVLPFATIIKTSEEALCSLYQSLAFVF